MVVQHHLLDLHRIPFFLKDLTALPGVHAHDLHLLHHQRIFHILHPAAQAYLSNIMEHTRHCQGAALLPGQVKLLSDGKRKIADLHPVKQMFIQAVGEQMFPVDVFLLRSHVLNSRFIISDMSRFPFVCARASHPAAPCTV